MLHWAHIAIDHEREARTAREQLASSAQTLLAEGEALDLSRELRPSLVAVTAAASAIDALYGEVKNSVGIATQHPGTPRHAHIFETLKRGFKVEQAWSRDLKWLFSSLRDSAVHPRTGFGEPESHPLGVRAAPEYAVYTVENASRAVDLLLEILTTCAEHPRETMEGWAEDARRWMPALIQARSTA